MSPSAWSDKDEAMYRGIRESNIERGVNKERAEEIAARTVNKHRQAKGRTPNKTTKGTGNPRTPLEDRTKQELYNRAQELDIEGRSGMTKDELVEAIRAAQESACPCCPEPRPPLPRGGRSVSLPAVS